MRWTILPFFREKINRGDYYIYHFEIKMIGMDTFENNVVVIGEVFYNTNTQNSVVTLPPEVSVSEVLEKVEQKIEELKKISFH